MIRKQKKLSLLPYVWQANLSTWVVAKFKGFVKALMFGSVVAFTIEVFLTVLDLVLSSGI